MSKTILVVSASPRKGGNSDLLCDQFILGANQAGHQAEKIFLKDQKINYCLGCMTCLKNGGTCVQRDDMDQLLPKMVSANAFVLASPIYFYNMNAQLKCFIDRCCPQYTRITQKRAFFILTSADTNASALSPAVAGFRGFLTCLKDVEEGGIIYGTGSEEPGAISGKPAMQAAFIMGQNA